MLDIHPGNVTELFNAFSRAEVVVRPYIARPAEVAGRIEYTVPAGNVLEDGVVARRTRFSLTASPSSRRSFHKRGRP